VVVNATGVWADDVRALDEGTHPHSLRPAKGIHVTVPRSKLPADIAAVIPVPKDRRSIFVVPWPDGDDVYLGTTDTAWDGPLDDPACLPEDVDYVLAAANGATTGHLTRDDITGVWAGLRPLLAPGGGHHVSERTADLSRRHTVRESPHGLVTVTGGKLTTYRLMAEDTVDVVVRRLGAAAPAGPRRHAPGDWPSGARPGLAALRRPGAAAEAGLDDATFAALVARHGGETPAVLALAADRPDLLEPLIPGLPHLRVEAVWAARQEMAVTVDDVLSRRTRATLRQAEAAATAAPAVADLLAPEWGRDPRDARLEAAAFAAEVHRTMTRAGLERRRARPGPHRADVVPAAGARRVLFVRSFGMSDRVSHPLPTLLPPPRSRPSTPHRRRSPSVSAVRASGSTRPCSTGCAASAPR
jgi:glycerol-3-phosphate dehydrogenase